MERIKEAKKQRKFFFQQLQDLKAKDQRKVKEFIIQSTQINEEDAEAENETYTTIEMTGKKMTPVAQSGNDSPF